MSSFSIVTFVSLLASVAAGPCDLYAAGNTPCVAAHSTTRNLYSVYNGPLYQVTRSDGQTADIGQPNGIADSAAQDTFCSGTDCLISIIYDQSGQKNHLTQGPKGTFPGGGPGGIDNLANATAAPVYVRGQKAYGVYVEPGIGYRNNQAVGTATGDDPEGIYAVLDGTHYNDGCCFDYGNAERDSTDTGNSHMEAIYFGNNTGYGTGAGDGPWIMADLENGLFASAEKQNPSSPSITARFITAIVKGEPNHWAIRGGDATTGPLSTYFDGVRPDGGYNPMNKEGSIILGIGGDNSNGARGTWYEGVMTAGYPTDDVENQVQADIVSQQYSVDGSNSNPPPPSSSTTSDTSSSTTATDTSTSEATATATTTSSEDGPTTTTDAPAPTDTDDGGDDCDGEE